jgi:hypothetical protein
MGPLLVFTQVMWSTARCCSDSSCEYGVFGVSFGLLVFFQGLGFGFIQGDGLD